MVPLARRVATVLLIALAVAGCGSPDTTSGRGQPSAADPAGTEVTEETYRAAAQSLLRCMSAYGYRVVGPVVSPFDQRLLRDVLPPTDGQDPAVFNSRLDRCDAASRLATIEPSYLTAHPGRLDPQLLPEARRCLRKQGIEPQENGRTYGDFVRRAPASQEFGKCMTEAARALFPDLPASITIFY